jgi:hypothetical protein
MPPQKNSGAKSSKRVSGVQAKNARFIQTFMSDIRSEGKAEDVYVSRVIARLGNGRMEVFYMDASNQPQTVQAVIRGSFRGKGKRSVWIDIGTIVVIADSGIAGSAEFEIMAILSADEIRNLRKEIEIDPRIFELDNRDKDMLKSEREAVAGGFEFEKAEEIGDDDIENI